ncbi:MAG: hypothetical protein ACRCTZ_17715 [Sarcina sp.]
MKLNNIRGIAYIAISFIFLSHVYDQKVLLLIGISLACTVMICGGKIAKLPILLCFLPWIEVLKLNSTQPTLYHLFYVVGILSILRELKKINMITTIFVFIFGGYITFVRIFSDKGLDIGIIPYFISFIFICLIFTDFKNYYDEKICIDLFYFGIITSFLAERVFREIPRMLVYLSTDTYASVASAIRYGGLFNDSNFISVVLLFCICFTITVLNKNKLAKKRKINLGILLLIIIGFGFSTSSKMFLVCLGIIGIWYFGKLLINFQLKKISLFLLLVVIGFLVAYENGVLDGILFRLNSLSGGQGDFSNGRIDIALKYFEEFYNNIGVFLCGIGMYDRVYLDNISTHNTWISMIYQMGVIGTFAIYMPMLYFLMKSAKNSSLTNNLLVWAIFFVCCSSLDLLMNEALPIYIILIVICNNLKGENVSFEGKCNNSYV